MFSKSDMQDIGALADFKAYMTGQEMVRNLYILQPLLIDRIDVEGHSCRRASIPYLAQDFLV